MKRERGRGNRGGEVEKMQRGECGLLETASSVVVMQDVAELATLEEKTYLACSDCAEKGV